MPTHEVTEQLLALRRGHRVSCGSFESRTVAHAEAAVAAELRPPGDLRAFVGPEQAIRSLPTDRRKVVCEKTCSLWCYSFTGQAV